MKKKPIKTKFIFITIALLFATPAWAETVLYCESELGTGIIKKNGSWITATYQEDGYTVRFDEKKMILEGFDYPMKCKFPFPQQRPNRIFCEMEWGDEYFHFNKKNLRFSYYEIPGSAWVSDGTDTSNMQHGTCEKFK